MSLLKNLTEKFQPPGNGVVSDFQFSKELINECIETFRSEGGLELSPAEANEILITLGGFFLSFSEKHTDSPLA